MISVSDIKKSERLMKQKHQLADKMLQAIADTGSSEIEGLSDAERSEIFFFLQKEEFVIFHERILGDGIPPETVPNLSSLGIWVLGKMGTKKYLFWKGFRKWLLISGLVLLIASAIVTPIITMVAHCKK